MRLANISTNCSPTPSSAIPNRRELCGRTICPKTDNYSGAVYDFSMIIDRVKVPTAADYVRRACAYCCGQVSFFLQRLCHRFCLKRAHRYLLMVVIIFHRLSAIDSHRAPKVFETGVHDLRESPSKIRVENDKDQQRYGALSVVAKLLHILP